MTETTTARHHRRVAHVRAIADDPRGDPNQSAAARTVLAKMTRAAAPDITGATSWRRAVGKCVRHYTAAGLPFTAGDIAREIRVARSDLGFRFATLAEFVGARLIRYDGLDAVEVTRWTEGTSRSPDGSRVVVYAPSVAVGLSHPFEVDIPRGGQRALGAGS